MDELFESENQYGDVDMDVDLESGEQDISQEDAWVVINSYFEKRGLVKQQLDSFDQFIVNSIQEMVDDSGEIVLTPENQYVPGKEAEMVSRVYLVPPSMPYKGSTRGLHFLYRPTNSPTFLSFLVLIRDKIQTSLLIQPSSIRG